MNHDFEFYTIMIIIGIVGYVIPMVYNFVFIHRMHYHKHGDLYGCKPDKYDLWTTFCPFVNLYYWLWLLNEDWRDKRYRTKEVKVEKEITLFKRVGDYFQEKFKKKKQ